MNDSSGSPERADLLEPTSTQHEARPASRANADPGKITLAQHEASLRDRCWSGEIGLCPV